MNLLSKTTLTVAAATVALSTVMLSESVLAFEIRRTAGNVPQPGINAPLAAPTVIDFNGPSFTGQVPGTVTTLVANGPNGGAKIQKTAGDANYQGSSLRIGTPGKNGTAGKVSFTFDDPRGLGYFGFFLPSSTAVNEVVSFFGANGFIQSFTGADLNKLLPNGNYINFRVQNNGEIFNRVDFTRNLASGSAFSVDNVAYQAIPTPALLPGLVAFGVGVMRKRKAEAKATA